MNRQRVTDVVRTIREFGTFEGDRATLISERTINDIMVTVDLTIREASDVHAIVNADPMARLQELTDKQCVDLKDLMVEGFHNGFDGWDEQDKIVIELFIDDLLLGMEES